MALYKNEVFLRRIDDAQFDVKHKLGAAAPYTGIYRCIQCGHEIALTAGQPLPTKAHPLHAKTLGTIEWQLIVYARHNKEPQPQPEAQ